MKNFVEITDLPIYDLKTELDRLLDIGQVSWYQNSKDQLCLNSIPEDPNNIHLGRGSLYWSWDNFKTGTDSNTEHLKRPERKLEESDFNILCEPFKGTLFEDVYNSLNKKYHLGRVRIMRSMPKTCLTWHWDDHPRVHFVMKTQPGCFMVFEDEVKHLPNQTWWWTNTLNNHTAFNGSKEDRYHLVATIVAVK